MGSGMLTFWVYYSFLFTLMLWSMTLLAKFFYTNSYFVVKLKFYECGFKPVKSNYVFYDINFTLMLLFLLVYDLELAVLLPYTLVFTKGSLVAFSVIFLFFVLLVLTMIIDVRYLSLDWQAR